ncbi:hypothetical protein [Candidatus Methylomirabilis sp.]|uniref:hypothetical protein n=1 Tax=Candidatus Methylomirabilis sp. TaxID=2032687 RepID=UPI003C713BAE
MSGPKLITPNKMSEDQIDIVDMVKELLALCLEGKITTVGIVGCRENGFFSAMRGRQAADLNLACDELKKRILEEVLDTTTERNTRRSSILRN